MLSCRSSWSYEALFEARQSALAQEKSKSDEAPMLYSCGICGKGYMSSKATEQHLKSRSHILRVSQGKPSNEEEDKATIRPLPRCSFNGGVRMMKKVSQTKVDSNQELAAEEASDSLSKLNVNVSQDLLKIWMQMIQISMSWIHLAV